MENIKVILDEVFGKSCNSIACDTYKYKKDCNLLNKFINDIKDKGLNAKHKEMIKMVNQSADNNKQENKFKNVSDDEIYAKLKRRKANKSVEYSHISF